jgi:hypothetical protein
MDNDTQKLALLMHHLRETGRAYDKFKDFYLENRKTLDRHFSGDIGLLFQHRANEITSHINGLGRVVEFKKQTHKPAVTLVHDSGSKSTGSSGLTGPALPFRIVKGS